MSAGRPKMNGLACPSCGSEESVMFDTRRCELDIMARRRRRRCITCGRTYTTYEILGDDLRRLRKYEKVIDKVMEFTKMFYEVKDDSET